MRQQEGRQAIVGLQRTGVEPRCRTERWRLHGHAANLRLLPINGRENLFDECCFEILVRREVNLRHWNIGDFTASECPVQQAITGNLRMESRSSASRDGCA